MEFKGMDLEKHGESAYPAAAWVESQYGSGGAKEGGALPANMSGNKGASMSLSGQVNIMSKVESRICPAMTSIIPCQVKEDSSGEAYNNPFEMVPTTGKLFKQMSQTFLAGAGSGQPGKAP